MSGSSDPLEQWKQSFGERGSDRNMPIVIPRLTNRYCAGISVCGELTNQEPNFLKKIKHLQAQSKVLAVEVQRGRVPEVAVLDWGGGDDRHIHVDIYKKKFLNLDELEFTSSVEEIQGKLDEIVGEQVLANLKGRFRVPVKIIPERGVIHSTFFRLDRGGFSIASTGGEFAIEGAPIKRMAWSLDEKREYLYVEMSTKVILSISEKYLEDIYETFVFFFKSLVMGDASDA